MIKTYCNAEQIPDKCCKGGRSQVADVREFIASGKDACEITIEKGRNATSLVSSYATLLKRKPEFAGVKAIRRQGRVFLIRTDKEVNADA